VSLLFLVDGKTKVLNNIVWMFFLDSFFYSLHIPILLRVFQKNLELTLCSFSCLKINENETKYNFVGFFFHTRHGNTKSETHGVSFKLFSHSIKMKRLSRNLVLFTLVKVFEENIRWAIGCHFFGLIELLYKKMN
jgi:hypothetical protein